MKTLWSVGKFSSFSLELNENIFRSHDQKKEEGGREQSQGLTVKTKASLSRIKSSFRIFLLVLVAYLAFSPSWLALTVVCVYVSPKMWPSTDKERKTCGKRTISFK